MILRCTLDQLLLFAHPHPSGGTLVVYDGDESFELERVEAVYYEVAAASPEERVWLESAGYRLLKLAADFTYVVRRKLA